MISFETYSISQIYLRINQLGYFTNELKTAIIFSASSLDGKIFKVINHNKNKVAFTGRVFNNLGKWGIYSNNYRVDFSAITEEGDYVIEIENYKSHRFKISNKTYDGIVDSLLKFFKVQRCGPTNPILHKVCHLYDAPRLVGDNSVSWVDVTGGWHDAGDYIKFFTTTAFSTYLLLFTYEFNSQKFEYDNDNSGAPDILEEARVGIDWLLRANYSKNKFVNVVQDLRDHEVGWRLPENDTLKFDRPAFSGIGKNQIGIFCAVMSLASRIWRSRFYDDNYAYKCLNSAENIYSLYNLVPNVDSNPTGMYQDSKFFGKLALGAIELYNTTKKFNYLKDAFVFADSAKSDYWWSWGDINSLVHYKLSSIDPKYKNYLYENLKSFNLNKNTTIYGEAPVYNWGTTNVLLGISLQAILWEKLTGSNEFDSLKIFQVDYILGKNPWGVSFIHNIGTEYVKNLHSQVAYFSNNYLPGGISAGPSLKSILDNYKINRTNFSYNKFNSNKVLFYDDIQDYITNEPTIVTNATAIFVFGNF